MLRKYFFFAKQNARTNGVLNAILVKVTKFHPVSLYLHGSRIEYFTTAEM